MGKSNQQKERRQQHQQSFLTSIHQRALDVAQRYRACEMELLDALELVDKHRVYYQQQFSSLFAYATEALGLSEAVAYIYIGVVRKSQEVPELKQEIKAGRISITKARKIVSVLNEQNKAYWLRMAQTQSKAKLEKLVAGASPHTAVRERMSYIHPQQEVSEKARIISLIEPLALSSQSSGTLSSQLGDTVPQLSGSSPSPSNSVSVQSRSVSLQPSGSSPQPGCISSPPSGASSPSDAALSPLDGTLPQLGGASFQPSNVSPQTPVKVRVQLQVGVSEKLMLDIRRAQDVLSQKRQRSVSLEETLAVMTQLYLQKEDPLEKAKRQKIRGKLQVSQNKKDQTQEGQNQEDQREEVQKHEGRRLENHRPESSQQKIQGQQKGGAKNKEAHGTQGVQEIRKTQGVHGTWKTQKIWEVQSSQETQNTRKTQGSLEAQSTQETQGALEVWGKLEAVTDELVPGPENVDDVSKAEKTQTLIHSINSVNSISSISSRKSARQAIGASIKHQLHLKYKGQCSYKDVNGKRCQQRRFLHIHHIQEVAQGGSNDINNLILLCSGHHRAYHSTPQLP